MRRLVVVLLGLLLLALPTPAWAQAAALSGSSTAARSGETTTLTWTLTDDGAPPAGQTLVLERWNGSSWAAAGTGVTDAAGRASVRVTLSRTPAENRFRATRPAGEGLPAVSAEHQVRLLRWASTLSLTAPKTVVDEKKMTVRLSWRTAADEPVSGWVRLQAKERRGKAYRKKWRTVARVRTDARGRAEVVRTPRWDTRWRAVADAQPWVEGDTSGVRRTDNRPPGTPVGLPRAAPRPRVSLPPQRRAVGKGANVTVRRIPTKVWRSMVGRSWHRGCPVGRAGLRLVEVNYWGFDGYRRRGEMVVAASVTSNFAGAFTEMHEKRVPVRSMYRVDRFGWSKRLGGADDHRSMAADNTSVFNCRGVVGNPGVRSPHSYGRSLDLNPWENPYFSRTGVVPNRWWAGRSHPRVAWRNRGHAVVQLLARHGFRWTYGTSDAHHFDAVAGAGGARLRALLDSEACTVRVCH